MGIRRLRVSTWIAKKVLEFGQHTPLHGRGGYGQRAAKSSAEVSSFREARTEAARVSDFFRFFGGRGVQDALFEKDVLDFGSGYGGRTVEYARAFCARFVWGVEPFTNVVAESNRYAESEAVANVRFLVCGHTSVPLADESIDVIVSYDVLEHVADPRLSIQEMYRVLRPGGSAYLVFPVYFGAFSHHLDYISLFPGLHWVFSPVTLVQAVNSILATAGSDKFGTGQQPRPAVSFDGARLVLPTLNGLGGEHLGGLFRDFSSVRIARHGWISRRQPQSAAMKMLSTSRAPNRLLDALTSSVSCVLTKGDT